MSAKAVLISIHPSHAEKIISGEKKLEFRRSWTNSSIDRIVIYATSPIQRIIGVAEVKRVFSGSPTKLWRLAKSGDGGISRRALFSYFKGKEKAFAIELGQVHVINGGGLPISIFGKDFRPPQSFRYLSEDDYSKVDEFMKKSSPKR